jgi:glycosyltransferase involved in cell wall biosynthesis
LLVVEGRERSRPFVFRSTVDRRPSTRYNRAVTLSVVIITCNEEENLPRTLKSVEGLVRDLGGEIIVVDSGSTDRTVEIAKSFGAKVFVEEWKGFAAQKNSAIEKASGEWVLLLDADEKLDSQCAEHATTCIHEDCFLRESEPYDTGLLKSGYWIARKNLFLGRWLKHGGFWPDRKLRLFKRGAGHMEQRAVHETVKVDGPTANLKGALIHHAYPTLSAYIEHMNRYSSLGAEMVGPRSFSFIDIFIRPRLTFFYNYFLRLGFLDGREGFLLHLYHSVYVSWKYAKAWELSRKSK